MKLLLPGCHASQHSHLRMSLLICPDQSYLLCHARLSSAKWTCKINSAVLSHFARTAHVLLGFLSSLMGSLPHLCSTAGFLNARRCFDAWKRETMCRLPPLCCRREVGVCVGDKHSGDQAGTNRCKPESKKKTETGLVEIGSDLAAPFGQSLASNPQTPDALNNTSLRN